MADPKPPDAKTLEMRVAELEDRLSKLHVTEDELKAYHKVSSLVNQNAPQAGCIVDCSHGCINECMIRACTIRACTIRACTYECGGGCAPGGGGGFGGGGFGGFGG